MKLCELMRETYIEDGNAACVLNIVSPDIREMFAREYLGEKMFPGGVNGRISDIPAYYGDFDVRFYSTRYDGNTLLSMTVEI